MTDPKHTKLASRYANLRGASLLEAIADDPRDAAILEAVWRLGEPITASQVVGPMLKTEAPHLVELVLDEILAATLDNPLRTQVVTALGERRPALPNGRAVELAQRLRNPEPLHGHYERYRTLFEMWALEQDGKVGEDFAIDVISGTTPQAANGTVRESAYQRCRSSERVMNAAGEALTAKLRPPQALDELAPVVASLLHRRDLGLVRRARDAALSGGRGALGLADALTALAEGRVDRLLLDGSVELVGAVTPGGELVPAGVVPPGVMGSELRSEPLLADRAALRALESGAHVTVVGGEAALALGDADGIAALLRW